MIKNTARIDTIYPHLTLQNKQSVSPLSFTLANLQFACQLTAARYNLCFFWTINCIIFFGSTDETFTMENK